MFDSGLEMGAAMTEKVEFERKQIPISLTDYESAQESKREREGEKSHFQFHCHMKGAQKGWTTNYLLCFSHLGITAPLREVLLH